MAYNGIGNRLGLEGSRVKTLSIDLPDKVAREIDIMVAAGWFRSSDDFILQAIREFADRNRLQLAERYQLEDIDWATKQKNPSGLGS